jgi:DNA-directed RNA polymerase I subunit RPA2
MLVEAMAGKAGATHGSFQDATPFRFDAVDRPNASGDGNGSVKAVDYFGEQLAAAGYNYYGTETMYSGVTVSASGVVCVSA